MMDWQAEYGRLFIDGAWVASQGTDTIAVVSPFTETVIADVPDGTVADIDRAVASARAAFDSGPWPRMSVAERIEALGRLSSLLRANHDAVAELITDEVGSPITLSDWYQAGVAERVLDVSMEIAAAYPFEELRTSVHGEALVTREPVGVVAAIVPWNAPLVTTMTKLAPALLVGCTVVLKPAPETPLYAYLLAEAIREAGLPPGVVNVVPAGREVSEHLVRHPDIDKVSFTGSTAAGSRIASICGGDFRRVTLELGGKSAGIILDDADLDLTMESLRLGCFRNTGQICTLKTRLLVPRALKADVVDRLVSLVASMPVGDPHDRATEFGPLASDRQRQRVEHYIASGIDQGAALVRGGGRPEGLDRGWFVEPTIFADVLPDMTIAQEEIFGPVVSVITYDSDEDAVAIANNSSYGLSGAVFSTDAPRALAIARRIRTGTVELNGSPIGSLAPTGGFKASGIGREGGPEGLDAYVELRSIGIPSEFRDQIL